MSGQIELRGLTKIFGPEPEMALRLVRDGLTKDELLDSIDHVLALNAVDLDVAPGRIHVVMGLSGSGKSTLVRLINRLIEPTAGDVRIDGRDVTKLAPDALIDLRRRTVSMVFQRFALMPHKTVLENVAYGLAVQGLVPAQRRVCAIEWVERVGLAGYAERYPAELSGGMQQRVGLARALCAGAEILLMDEPFSALDPLIRTEMQDVLLALQSELKKTILFITHDLGEALRMGQRIAILRDGVVVQDALPEEIVLKPADAHVADFVRDINRGRVLTAGAVVARTPLTEVSGPTIAAAATLEDTAARLAQQHADACIVVAPGDRVVGRLTLAEILAAMARPR